MRNVHFIFSRKIAKTKRNGCKITKQKKKRNGRTLILSQSCLQLCCPVLSCFTLSSLSCLGCHATAMLSSCPVLSVSRPGCNATAILSSCLVIAVLSRLFCPSCPVSRSADPPVIFWLSCLSCSGCLSCHVLAVISSFSCPSCPVLTVLSRLCCTCCPVLVVL
jgi:hypothetical protein